MIPDILNAIANILWPITVFVIAVLFRGEISSLLQRITHAKGFGAEIEFERRELREKVELAQAAKSSFEFTIENHKNTRSSEVDLVLSKEKSTGQLRYPMISDNLGLLIRPINETVIESLRRRIYESPFEALILVAAQLEISMKEALAAQGISNKTIPKSRLSQITITHFKLSPTVETAINKFFEVRNKIIHSTEQTPQEALLEIDILGLNLVEMIQRIPRDLIYVESAQLPVFYDQECRKEIENYTAVTITFCALPGQTGHRDVYLTTKPMGYYPALEKVSSEWQDGPKLECWFWDKENKKSLKIQHADQIFVGRLYKELID